MSDALKSNSTLNALFLEENLIGDSGLSALGEALKSNSTLTMLSIRHNSITDHAIPPLLDVLQSNTTLTNINFTFNKICDFCTLSLLDVLVSNSGNVPQIMVTPQLLILDIQLFWKWPKSHFELDVEKGMSVEMTLLCFAHLSNFYVPEEIATLIMNYWGLACKIRAYKLIQQRNYYCKARFAFKKLFPG